MPLYFGRKLRTEVKIDWSAASDWNNFSVLPVSFPAAAQNTITLGGANGIGTAAGSVSGDGNDRRFYTVNGFSAKNGEIEAAFDLGAGPGQLGIFGRLQSNIAIIAWTNIIFVSAALLNGIWEFTAGTGALDTNQKTSATQFGTPIVSGSGTGSVYTVKSLFPHGLVTGDLVDLTNINAGLPNNGACTVVDGLTFTVASAVTGPHTTGYWALTSWRAFGRAKMRLIGNVMQSKQWLSTESEPPWGDSLRTVTNILPTTLTSGSRTPVGRGKWGLAVDHLGSTKTVRVSNFAVASLD